MNMPVKREWVAVIDLVRKDQIRHTTRERSTGTLLPMETIYALRNSVFSIVHGIPDSRSE